MAIKALWIFVIAMLLGINAISRYPGFCTQDISGQWQGMLKAGAGLRIVVKIARATNGAWDATLYSIDQTAEPIPVSSMTLQGSNLQFTVDAVHGSYKGTMSPDGASITGIWTQASPLPLDFGRATGKTAWVTDVPRTTTLTPSQVDSVLTNIENAFRAYVFPDVAAKAVTMLKENTHKYEASSYPMTFALTVTNDLLALTHDKHIRIMYPLNEQAYSTTAASQAALHADTLAHNFGFVSVRRLLGNVGYIDFRYFSSDAEVGQTIASAMTFLANTDALIIDLRYNGGGDPKAAQTLEAYFFNRQQQITSIIWRNPETGALREEQQFTAATVPGPLYVDKPVYLLTSSRTFSCAEQFIYDLHNLKRVTVVGETTGGGAHPGGVRSVGAGFGIFIPFGRAYSPITKTDWEGTGIAPDVKASEAQAFVTAYKLALNYTKVHEKDPTVLTEVSTALAGPAKALSISQ